ncbi:MAG: hypothetical protein R3D67_03430 [Hyphomicrobiaceae bacterium]
MQKRSLAPQPPLFVLALEASRAHRFEQHSRQPYGALGRPLGDDLADLVVIECVEPS